jgi:hypothetical protein
MGIFEPATLLRDGTGERALFMPEQLGFEQVAGNGAAIHGNIGPCRTGALAVNGSGDHFLAGAGGAGDDDGCGARRDLADQIADFGHGAALANQAGFGAGRGKWCDPDETHRTGVSLVIAENPPITRSHA